MEPIKKLLSRYKKLRPPDEHVRLAVQKEVLSVCGVSITKQNISYRGSTVYLTTTSSIRSTILVRKQEILDALDRQIGKNRVRDIR